ncbi:hypothetical protein BDW67DRAFT_79342 [Aspergillus spinulosporus]
MNRFATSDAIFFLTPSTFPWLTVSKRSWTGQHPGSPPDCWSNLSSKRHRALDSRDSGAANELSVLPPCVRLASSFIIHELHSSRCSSCRSHNSIQCFAAVMRSVSTEACSRVLPQIVCLCMKLSQPWNDIFDCEPTNRINRAESSDRVPP